MAESGIGLRAKLPGTQREQKAAKIMREAESLAMKPDGRD